MSLLTTECNAASSCGYHRIALPFAHIEVEPKVPVFVFNRTPACGVYGLGALRMRGIKIVLDLDDYWALPETHYMHARYAKAMTSVLIRECLGLADIITVTTAALASRVRTVTRVPVVIVPNALPFDQGQFKAGVAEPQTRFIYAAGPSHYEDVKLVAKAFNTHDVTIAGVTSAQPEWHRICALVPQASLSAVRPIADYMRSYAGYSVALAPLVDSDFNRCKSNLKMLEAGARNIPLLASGTSPYDTAFDRPYMLFAANLAEWKLTMQQCRDNPEWAVALGRELGAHVRKHYQLSDANNIRRQIIESFS